MTHATRDSNGYAGPRIQGKDRRFRAAPGMGWSQRTVAQTPVEARFATIEWPEKTTACVWPLWGDKAPASEARRFCGDTRIEGRPYCASHCSAAYRPAEKAAPVLFVVKT